MSKQAITFKNVDYLTKYLNTINWHIKLHKVYNILITP